MYIASLELLSQPRRMTGRKGILFVLEWLIVADQATAFTSGCTGGFCFISSPPGTNMLSWDSAQRWCSSNGTRLIEITNKDIQDALYSFMNSIRGTYNYDGWNLFTNGKRTAGSWKWVTRNTTSSLSVGGEVDASYAYGYLQLTSSGFTIGAYRPVDMRQGYICENETQCNFGTGVLINFRCYKSYSNEALSWYDARERCLSKGGDLASFEFIINNTGLSVLNGSLLTPSTTYWIDLRREWWTWQGLQVDVKYSHWLTRHPVMYLTDINDCLCLQPSSWNWTECRCGESKPFVCISDDLTSLSTTATSTTTTATSTTTSASKPTPTLSASTETSTSLASESIGNIMNTDSSQHSSVNAMPTSLYSSSTTAVAAESQKQGGSLDRDIAIGIGVGVGGGVAVVVLVVIVAVIIIRKRSKESVPEKKEKTKKPKKPQRKTKQLQTPDIIALQTATNPEETPYVTVIRLPDFDETNVSDKPETVYANLEFFPKSSLADNSSPDVISDTGSSRPSSPSRLAEADVEVGQIDYNDDQYTIATCATFL